MGPRTRLVLGWAWQSRCLILPVGMRSWRANERQFGSSVPSEATLMKTLRAFFWKAEFMVMQDTDSCLWSMSITVSSLWKVWECSNSVTSVRAKALLHELFPRTVSLVNERLMQDWVVNSSGSAGHSVSVAASQLSCWSAKAAISTNESAWPCSNTAASMDTKIWISCTFHMSERFFCSFLSTHSTTVNIVLWGIQKYLVSWIWSTGYTPFLLVYTILSTARSGALFSHPVYFTDQGLTRVPAFPRGSWTY